MSVDSYSSGLKYAGYSGVKRVNPVLHIIVFIKKKCAKKGPLPNLRYWQYKRELIGSRFGLFTPVLIFHIGGLRPPEFALFGAPGIVEQFCYDTFTLSTGTFVVTRAENHGLVFLLSLLTPCFPNRSFPPPLHGIRIPGQNETDNVVMKYASEFFMRGRDGCGGWVEGLIPHLIAVISAAEDGTIGGPVV